MTAPPRNAPAGPIRVMLILAASLGLAIAGWLPFRSYTSDAARECITLYNSAQTSADTIRIDSLIPRGGRAESDPRTCGFLRTSARWQ
jgi:hypothetical protein